MKPWHKSTPSVEKIFGRKLRNPNESTEPSFQKLTSSRKKHNKTSVGPVTVVRENIRRPSIADINEIEAARAKYIAEWYGTNNKKKIRSPRRKYMTNSVKLGWLRGSKHDSRDVWLLKSRPKGLPDNMQPPSLHGSLAPSFIDVKERRLQGQKYDNLMFDIRVRRGFYTMDPDEVGKHGKKPALPLGTTIPPCPPRYPDVSPSKVAREFDCGVHPRKSAPRQDVNLAPKDSYATVIQLEPPESLQKVLNLMKDTEYMLPKSRQGIPRMASSNSTNMILPPLRQLSRIGPCGAAPTCGPVVETTKDVCGHPCNRSVPAALMPTWETELAAATCHPNVDLPPIKFLYPRPKTYTVYTQTEPNIKTITGDLDVDDWVQHVDPMYIPDRALKIWIKKVNSKVNRTDSCVQVEPSEIWNYDQGVKPIVENMSACLLAQGITEMGEEEDLAILQDEVLMHEIKLIEEKRRLDRLKIREQDVSTRTVALIRQNAIYALNEIQTEKCIEALSFVRSYFRSSMGNAIIDLMNNGYIEDASFINVSTGLNPWMTYEVKHQLDTLLISRQLLDDIIHHSNIRREVNEDLINPNEEDLEPFEEHEHPSFESSTVEDDFGRYDREFGSQETEVDSDGDDYDWEDRNLGSNDNVDEEGENNENGMQEE